MTAGVVALGLVMVGLAADQGGYFATAWGWATLVLASVAALCVILGSRARFGLMSFGFAGAVTAFAAWVGVSAWWSSDVTGTSHDLERTAIYAAAALLVPATVARRRADWLVAAVFVLLSAVFIWRVKKEEALIMKQFPNQYPEYKKRTWALIPWVW